MSVQKYSFPIEDLLIVASSRLRRQRQFKRPLAKGGKSAVELVRWLDQASECLMTLAHPIAVFHTMNTDVGFGRVSIENQVTLNNPALATDLTRGGSLFSYLLTLGYSQANAFDWLNRDYMAHHIQSELAREVLYALGRNAHNCFKDVRPDRRLRRIPIRMEAKPGAPLMWDVSRVQALLATFGADNPGVSLTDTGCFQPLNSLLGLVVEYPLEAH